MLDPDQGTGRTWRLVNDARDGDAIVVASVGDRDQVRRFLDRQGRPADALRVIILDDARPADRLRGWPHDRRVYVDHYAHEAARLHPHLGRKMDELEHMALHRCGGVLHYPVAEPCDTAPPGRAPGNEAPGAGTSAPRR